MIIHHPGPPGCLPAGTQCQNGGTTTKSVPARFPAGSRNPAWSSGPRPSAPPGDRPDGGEGGAADSSVNSQIVASFTAAPDFTAEFTAGWAHPGLHTFTTPEI